MGIFVECEEDVGALAFQMLAQDLIDDLHAGRLIEDVRIYVELEAPFFYISIKPKKTIQKVTMSEVVSVLDEAPEKISIAIYDETYAPYLLPLLMEKFGDRVHQIERNKLDIDRLTNDELMAIPIGDIKVREIDDIINHIVFQIIPIGFRVVKNISKSEEEIRYIASENPITDEMVEKIEEIISKTPEELKLKKEDLIEPSKKEFVPSYKGSYV